MFAITVVKIDSKIIILLPWSKSVKQIVLVGLSFFFSGEKPENRRRHKKPDIFLPEQNRFFWSHLWRRWWDLLFRRGRCPSWRRRSRCCGRDPYAQPGDRKNERFYFLSIFCRRAPFGDLYFSEFSNWTRIWCRNRSFRAFTPFPSIAFDETRFEPTTKKNQL